MERWGEVWRRLEAAGWELWHEPTTTERWVVKDPSGAWWDVPAESGGWAARKPLSERPHRARVAALRMALGLGLGDESVQHTPADEEIKAEIAAEFRRGLS